jgi:hypothetical protein
MTSEEIKQLPHLGQITINAIVYKQLPDGNFHPEAVWYDSFAVNFIENSSNDCIEKIKSIIGDLKNDTNRPNTNT